MCYEPKTSAASPAPATRTTKEWFDTLPSPYREQALQNEPYARWYRQHRHLAAALAYGFSWASSPEGFDYWRAIQDRADKGEFNPPAPEPPAPPKVVGYRLLGPDEVVRQGDEYWFSQGAWELSNNIGQPACAFNAPYRRPITSYDDAPPAA